MVCSTRVRGQPEMPLADAAQASELADTSSRPRVLRTIDGNIRVYRPLPPAKARPSLPPLPPLSEPAPTLADVMSMDVLSLVFDCCDEGRGPLSLFVRRAANGLSASCRSTHAVAKEPLKTMHYFFSTLLEDANHFCAKTVGGTGTRLCKQTKVCPAVHRTVTPNFRHSHMAWPLTFAQPCPSPDRRQLPSADVPRSGRSCPRHRKWCATGTAHVHQPRVESTRQRRLRAAC